MRGGELRIHDLNGKARQAPFIANNRVTPKGPFRIRLSGKLADPEGGISVAWRLMGEDDFVKGNAATMKKNASGEFELLVPETETVIHLRIKLPEGNATIRQLRVDAPEGKLIQRFRF